MRISEDYCSSTGEYRRVDAAYRRESPVVLYRDGYYYMITSGLTGWDYNRAKYFRAKDLLGEWEDMGDPFVADEEGSSFCTQATSAFAVRGRDTVIYMAERHNTQNFLHCSYVWLPIRFGADATLSLSYREELLLDEVTAEEKKRERQ